MPVLMFSPPSPYSAKVRMGATYAGISFSEQIVDTTTDPAALLAANPLGKIPSWVEDDGVAVFDSRVIMQHLNRTVRNALYPTNAAKRLEAERLEALCDGISDCLLACIYETRYRPEDRVHQPWIDRNFEKAMRGLDLIGSERLGLPKKITSGHIALRSLIGYLDLRFAGKWERGRSKLKRYAAKFDERFPELAALAPKAA